jgi:hypothetical protein
MAGMRFQFSILTMLVCTAVLAVVCTVTAKVEITEQIAYPQNTLRGKFRMKEIITRQPTMPEVAWRMAWAGPLAVSVALCLLWTSPRIAKRIKRSGGDVYG